MVTIDDFALYLSSSTTIRRITFEKAALEWIANAHFLKSNPTMAKNGLRRANMPFFFHALWTLSRFKTRSLAHPRVASRFLIADGKHLCVLVIFGFQSIGCALASRSFRHGIWPKNVGRILATLKANVKRVWIVSWQTSCGGKCWPTF